MHNTVKLSENLTWVGVSDRRIPRFENIFPLTSGVNYNSYLITDEKTCLLDTVDPDVSEQFIDNIEHALGGRQLDYLVINHMEPDHCGSIERVTQIYPEVKLVGNSKTFAFLEQFYESDLSERYILVKEGEELQLGSHTLRFLMAPLVHWPEVMVTYDVEHKILFSADAFGNFGALNGNLYADEVDFKKDWLDEARRYYINIVGRHGRNVQNLFKKLDTLEIDMICSLHGHIYRTPEDVSMMIEKYRTWSAFEPERSGVVLVYSTMYGNTELVMNIMASKLAAKGIQDIQMYDVAQTDFSYIIPRCHQNSHIIFGIQNYNTTLYPTMDAFIRELLHTNFQNRKVGLVCNSSWGGRALKEFQEYLASNKGLEEFTEPLNILSALKPDQEALVDEFVDKLIASM